jgi:uncharacterized protein
VMRISLDEAAAKISAKTAPEDKEEDVDLPVWAGILPIGRTHGAPIAVNNVPVATPKYVSQWCAD